MADIFFVKFSGCVEVQIVNMTFPKLGSAFNFGHEGKEYLIFWSCVRVSPLLWAIPSPYYGHYVTLWIYILCESFKVTAQWRHAFLRWSCVNNYVACRMWYILQSRKKTQHLFQCIAVHHCSSSIYLLVSKCQVCQFKRTSYYAHSIHRQDGG